MAGNEAMSQSVEMTVLYWRRGGSGKRERDRETGLGDGREIEHVMPALVSSVPATSSR